MFLTAVILILFFSLSDLAKWMNQNGDTYALREFINLEKLCMLICFDTESKNKSIKLYYISMLFYSKFIFSFILYVSRFSVPSSKKLDVLNLYKFLYIHLSTATTTQSISHVIVFKKIYFPETQLYSYFSRFVKSSIYQREGASVKM